MEVVSELGLFHGCVSDASTTPGGEGVNSTGNSDIGGGCGCDGGSGLLEGATLEGVGSDGSADERNLDVLHQGVECDTSLVTGCRGSSLVWSPVNTDGPAGVVSVVGGVADGGISGSGASSVEVGKISSEKTGLGDDQIGSSVLGNGVPGSDFSSCGGVGVEVGEEGGSGSVGHSKN